MDNICTLKVQSTLFFLRISKIEKYKIIARYHISQWLLLRGLLLYTVPYSFLSFSKLTKFIIPIITLSGKVGGMASLAGAPYVSIYEATDEEILEMAQSLASNGLIDSLENMRDDNIYIFQGLVDTITPWCKSLLIWRNNDKSTKHQSLGQAARMEGFYQNFLSSDSVVENKDDIESEHGFV